MAKVELERLSENPRLPNRRPYELLRWGMEGPFLQCCATKTHAPEATEQLFRQFQKGNSAKFVSDLSHNAVAVGEKRA